jgi:hypothetical protein
MTYTVILVGNTAVHKFIQYANYATDLRTRKSGFNPLVPSDSYMGHTAQLTSRRYILNTYSTNIRTEYFKRAA